MSRPPCRLKPLFCDHKAPTPGHVPTLYQSPLRLPCWFPSVRRRSKLLRPRADAIRRSPSEACRSADTASTRIIRTRPYKCSKNSCPVTFAQPSCGLDWHSERSPAPARALHRKTHGTCIASDPIGVRRRTRVLHSSSEKGTIRVSGSLRVCKEIDGFSLALQQGGVAGWLQQKRVDRQHRG